MVPSGYTGSPMLPVLFLRLASGPRAAILSGLLFLLVNTPLITSMAQQQEACPCCHPEARQFDFWAGEWETYTPDGKLSGTNRIVLLQDSCVLQENWTSNGSGYTGTSYNFYNPASRKWQQLWLDNQGGNLQLEGSFSNGSMVLVSKELPNRDKKLQIDRITWTPNKDGTVRQLWETSTDKGETWKTIFDGLYKRIK